MNESAEFFSHVDLGRVMIAVVATAGAVILGIWWPARVMERYTNQPAVRWVWYVAGVLILIMVYVSMYGYGLFWELYGGEDFAA